MKFRYKYKIQALLLSGLLLVSGACKDFVNINDDPNNPTVPVISLVLPATQLSMVGNMNGVNNGASSIMQHIVSSINRYQQTGTSFQDSWNGFYTQTLKDIETVIKEGTAQEQWGYVAVAKLEKAYLYSIMVDLWGDVPYAEAVQGSENESPAFESGAVIYDKLFLLIDEALADLDKVNTTLAISPASSDVFYSGNKANWVRMANSLKLKLYNQIRLSDPAKATAGIQALLTSNAPLITDNAQDFTFRFGASINPNNRHPWYTSHYQASKDFYMDQNMIERLFNNDDPRLRYYIFRQNPTAYIGNSSTGNGYYGRYPGDPTASPADNPRRATVGIYPAGGLYDNGIINNLPAAYIYLTNTNASATANRTVGVTDGTGAGITPLITNAMVKFIRAEAALTLNTGEDARQLFIDAITAHLNTVSSFRGAPAITNISGFVQMLARQYDAANAAGKLAVVMNQKYIALYGNGIEAYNDYRRTGLPVLGAPLAPLNSFPLRFYYSDTELSSNSAVVAQANDMQVAQQVTPVFWDK